MKRALSLVVGTACWMLVGCAGPAERPSTAGATAAVAPAKAKKPDSCRDEAAVGSIIKRTRCVSDEQSEKEREAAERSMKSNNDKSNSRSF
jgi:hypothetical protein